MEVGSICTSRDRGVTAFKGGHHASWIMHHGSFAIQHDRVVTALRSSGAPIESWIGHGEQLNERMGKLRIRRFEHVRVHDGAHVSTCVPQRPLLFLRAEAVPSRMKDRYTWKRTLVATCRAITPAITNQSSTARARMVLVVAAGTRSDVTGDPDGAA